MILFLIDQGCLIQKDAKDNRLQIPKKRKLFPHLADSPEKA
jgi:hypothetical protein